MRKPEDGDIKPTKKAMKEAYDILANIVELIGEMMRIQQNLRMTWKI